MFQLIKNIWRGKIFKAKYHVHFYIKFNSESFHICSVDSFGCPSIDNY